MNRTDQRFVIPGTTQSVHAARLHEVIEWLADGESGVIVGHNLHSLYLSETDDQFAAVYRNASLVLVDGMPVRWLLALRRRDWAGERLGSCDWLAHLHRAGLERIAVIGGTPDVNAAFVEALLAQSAGKYVTGWDGYAGLAQLVELNWEPLAACRPELIIVGLGMPLQESFIPEIESRVPMTKVAAVGGAIDQMVGVQRRAPRAVQRLGLEWLFRLVRDPRRLASRYLVEPWKLAYVLGRKRLVGG